MEKILENGAGSYYIDINGQISYFCGLAERKKTNGRVKTDDMIMLTMKDVVNKIDEIVDELNRRGANK